MLNFSSFENTFIKHYPPVIIKQFDISYVDQLLLTSAMTDDELKKAKELSKQVTTRYRKGTENVSNKIRQTFKASKAKDIVTENFLDLAADFDDEIEIRELIKDIRTIYHYDASIHEDYRNRWDALAKVDTFVDFLVEVFMYAVIQTNEIPQVSFPCTNIPARCTKLFGYDGALDYMYDAFMDGKHIIAVSGDVGTGKSALVAEYIYRNSEAYDLVWWLSGKSIETLKTDCLEFLDFLGRPDDLPDGSALLKTQNYFNNRTNYLLVIDDADGVEGDLNKIIPQNVTGHIIVISRKYISGYEDEVKTSKFVPAHIKDFILSSTGSTDQQSAYTIAKLLDGNQLAITNAINFIKGTGKTLAEYLELLEKSGVNRVIDAKLGKFPGEESKLTEMLATQYLLLKKEASNTDNELIKDIIYFLEYYAFVVFDELPVLALIPPFENLDIPNKLTPKLQDELYFEEFKYLLLQYGFFVKNHNDSMIANTLLLGIIRDLVGEETFNNTYEDCFLGLTAKGFRKYIQAVMKNCKALSYFLNPYNLGDAYCDEELFKRLDYAAFIKDFGQDMQTAIIKAEIDIPEGSHIRSEAETTTVPHNSMEYVRILLNDTIPFMKFMTGCDYVPYYFGLDDDIRMLEVSLKDK